jgi:hypothetical protein
VSASCRRNCSIAGCGEAIDADEADNTEDGAAANDCVPVLQLVAGVNTGSEAGIAVGEGYGWDTLDAADVFEVLTEVATCYSANITSSNNSALS